MFEIPHFTDDDQPIRIEITSAAGKNGLQEATRSGASAADKIKTLDDAALFEAFRAIYKVARKTELLIGDLNVAASSSAAPLSGAEIQFGIKFDSGVNAVITSSIEATINVKLTWGKP